MKVQNLTREQKPFRAFVLDWFLVAALIGVGNSLASLAVTGNPLYWILIAVSLFFAYVALKLRPFDDLYRSMVRSAIDKC